MSLVSFIIPSINRSTLGRTLQSLVHQTDRDWSAIVVFDGVRWPSHPVSDRRILYHALAKNVGHGHCSGAVRNAGIKLNTSPWIGFVDDDDTVDFRYVSWLREEQEGQDVVVFKMRYQPKRDDGAEILPRGELKAGEVGISFAIRTEFVRQHGIEFPTCEFEDFRYLQACMEKGAKLIVSERVAYFVRH